MSARTGIVMGLIGTLLVLGGCLGSQNLTDPNGLRAGDKALEGLGDRVWLDANRNGLQDAGEPGLAGVLVTLQDCEGLAILSDTTSADGMYRLGGFETGSYQIHFAVPEGYALTAAHAGTDSTLDSDADPLTGLTACLAVTDSTTDDSIDAGLYALPGDAGCAHGRGYWKHHLDEVDALLPLSLGLVGGASSLAVADTAVAYDVLAQKTYGTPSNGITRLYAKLLTAKLSIANGADGTAAESGIAAADTFLADHDYADWDSLDCAEQHWVKQLGSSFRVVSIGTNCDDDDDHGSCGDGDHDDDDDDDDDGDGEHGDGDHDGGDDHNGGGDHHDDD